jgi:hypothetical protein
MRGFLFLMLLLAVAGGTSAEAKDAKLADRALATQVRSAVSKASQYLVNAQRRDGSWAYDAVVGGMPGQKPREQPHGTAGLTGLALYALASSGRFHAQSEVVARGVLWTKEHAALYGPASRWSTYASSFLLLALARVSPEAFGKRIHALASQLASTQLESGMWSYGPAAQGVEALGDNSNTQLAVLALWTAQEDVGFKVPKKVWTRVKSHFAKSQLPDGSWGYRPALKGRGAGKATRAKPAMTAAGLCSYLLASGGRKPDKVAKKALAAIKAWPQVAWEDPYLAWMMERVGSRLALPLADWYVPGARHLLKRQTKQGGWPAAPKTLGAHGDRRQVYETALRLLFLNRATAATTTGG